MSVIIKFTADRSLLEESIKETSEIIDGKKLEVAEIEAKTVELSTRLRQVTQAASALAGFIALQQAITGDIGSLEFQAAFAIGLNTLNQIILLQAVASVSGNFPLVLALGSIAGSVASTINQLRTLNLRRQQQLDALSRRQQSRKI